MGRYFFSVTFGLVLLLLTSTCIAHEKNCLKAYNQQNFYIENQQEWAI